MRSRHLRQFAVPQRPQQAQKQASRTPSNQSLHAKSKGHSLASTYVSIVRLRFTSKPVDPWKGSKTLVATEPSRPRQGANSTRRNPKRRATENQCKSKAKRQNARTPERQNAKNSRNSRTKEMTTTLASLSFGRDPLRDPFRRFCREPSSCCQPLAPLTGEVEGHGWVVRRGPTDDAAAKLTRWVTWAKKKTWHVAVRVPSFFDENWK